MLSYAKTLPHKAVAANTHHREVVVIAHSTYPHCPFVHFAPNIMGDRERLSTAGGQGAQLNTRQSSTLSHVFDLYNTEYLA